MQIVVIVSSGSDFFFFQAEDGIRDLTVTGVQTCALPISDGLCPAGMVNVEGTPRTVAGDAITTDRKSTRLNSSHSQISYAVFCLKKKKIDPDTGHVHEHVQCDKTLHLHMKK